MNKQTLEEISNWKLEAKLEDNYRYFYHIDELKRIENGSRCYVIGRKGTGKTAISEYLLKDESFNTFSIKLSFKNFPFKDKSFSNYLRSELEDEIHGFLPEIKQIIDIIAQIRKQEFSLQEFSTTYLSEAKRGAFEERNVEFVLTVLFIFNIIGNQPSQRNKKVFRYINKEARINFNEQFCVHRGLLKALQIF